MASEVVINIGADTKTAEKGVKGLKGKIEGMAKPVAVVSAAFAGIGAVLVSLGDDFTEAERTITAGTGATGEALEGLKESFKEVFANVPQDAQTVSSAIADVNTFFGSTGDELEEVTELFLDLSRVLGEDATPMISGVGKVMKLFNEPAEKTEEILSELMTASQISGASFGDLQKAVEEFAPVLAPLGVSLTDATALVANFENKGLDLKKVIPSLNTLFGKMAKEGVTDIEGAFKDLITQIQNAESDTEALKIAAANFGPGGATRMLKAIKDGAFDTEAMAEAMRNGHDAVKNMTEGTLTASEKFDIWKNKVKAMAEPLASTMSQIGPLVVAVPTLTAGISALAASHLVQAASAKIAAVAMGTLNIAMGPIGLVILAITAAIVAGIIIWKKWDVIIAAFKRSLGWLKDKLVVFKDGFIAIWKAIGNAVKDPINFIIRSINKLIELLKGIKIHIPSVGIGPARTPAFNLDPFKSLSTIPELAEGGIVRKPTLAILGEKGPEAVVPLGAGAGGGITITMTGNVYGFDDFEDRVAMAVRDGVRRGGFRGIIHE